MPSKIKELRDLSGDELTTRLRDLKQEALTLRIQQSTGQLEDTARRRQVRREIARVMTLLNEKKQQASS